MKNEEIAILVKAAAAARYKAQPHLSQFRVGAAIFSSSGKVYSGANIEFDNYSNTIHAEEAALTAMLMAGEFTPIAIAVCTGTPEPWFPCGMCRQSLFERGGPGLTVIACTDTKQEIMTMAELLPKGVRHQVLPCGY